MKKLILILLLLFSQTSFAESPQVKFSEISFKDNESDWIEISISPPLKNSIKIKEDKLITQILPGQISNEKYILIHFKSEKEKTESKNSILHIYITATGLTGTTEQLTIESDSKIIDAVCWENSSPTDSEQKDMEELLSKNAWSGNCINSEEIKKKQSIAATAQGWQIFKHPTPGEENKIKNSPPKAIITIQKGKLEQEVPFSLNLDGSDSYDPDNDELTYKWTFPNDKIVEKKNPPSHKFAKSGTYEISLTVTDELGLSSTETIQIKALPKTNKEFTDRITPLVETNDNSPKKPLPKPNKWQTYVFALIFTLLIPLIYIYKCDEKV